MPTDINTLFASLQDFTWKGISVPTTMIRWKFRQDLAQHKPADADGAHIEGTGRAPHEFEIHIPLYNTLTPGGSEGWSQPLIPGVLNTFVAACDKTTGALQVPLFGTFKCKFQDFDAVIDPNKRAGTEIVAHFIETIDDASASANQANPSAQASAGIIVDGLDSQLAQALVIAPSLPVPPVTFATLMGSVNAAVDSVTILQKRTAGSIAGLLYQMQNLENHLDLAVPTSPGSPSAALLWPLYSACENGKAALYATKKTLLTSAKNIALFKTLQDATFGAVYAQISAIQPNVDLSDLTKLNPGLFTSPIVPAGSTVRYYAS